MKKNSKVLNEEIEKKVLERIYAVDANDNFLNGIISAFEKEKTESDRNKKWHFLIETIVLVLSAFTTLLSAIGSGVNWPVPVGNIFGIVSAVISAAITCLIGIRGLRQWQETWLRHRKCLNQFYIECYNYAYKIGKYIAYDRSAAIPDEIRNEERLAYEERMFNDYKETVVGILVHNQEEFMKNMET